MGKNVKILEVLCGLLPCLVRVTFSFNVISLNEIVQDYEGSAERLSRLHHAKPS